MEIFECERENELFDRLKYLEKLLKAYRRLALSCKDYVIDLDDYQLIQEDLLNQEKEGNL